MNEPTPNADQQFLANAMTSFIQIAAMTILALWCFSILKPFLAIVIWAIIISVAIYPLHQSLANSILRRRLFQSIRWQAIRIIRLSMQPIIAARWTQWSIYCVWAISVSVISAGALNWKVRIAV